MLPLLVGLLAAAPAGHDCAAGLCQPEALAGFAAAITAPPADRPLHILQIGDSHTAGDAITSAWRDAWQARLGNGGRGMLPPGKPYKGFRARGLTITPSIGWTMKGVFGAVSADPRPPIGLSGYTMLSNTAGATLDMTADDGQGFDSLIVCALAGPTGGRIAVTLGAETFTMDMAGDFDRPVCRRFDVTGLQMAAQLLVVNGQARITSWGVLRRGPGLVLSNLGVPGSQLSHFARSDDSVIAEELRVWKPDLIVIAFGTNEGFAPRVDGFAIAATLREQVQRLRRLAGPVPILVIGAPDALSRNTALADNADGSAVDCNAAIDNSPRWPAALPMDQALDIADAAPPGGALVGGPPLMEPPPQPLPIGGDPVAPTPVATGRALFAPPGLAVVRAAQRRVAAELKLGYWDWQARTGGACAAVARVQANPPLMTGDFVHYTSAGGAEIARRLRRDLARANITPR